MVIPCASNIGLVIPAQGGEVGGFFLDGTTDWSTLKCAISPRNLLVWRVSRSTIASVNMDADETGIIS